jgi:signal transduction histidine kinase
MIGMSEHAAPDDMRQNARIIETQVKNISELLQRTLKFARDGAPEPAPTDLCALAEQVVSLLAPLAAARDASIELRAAAPLVASVPASRLLDTVAVLASWAVRRVAPGQKVSLSVERVESIQPPPGERGRARGGASALFRVRCPGVALSLSLLEHVYEPWLAETTEDRDTAITLAFAFGIAREHRGFVEAKPDGDGTTFLVCWPI